jgi:hypothetical protein
MPQISIGMDNIFSGINEHRAQDPNPGWYWHTHPDKTNYEYYSFYAVASKQVVIGKTNWMFNVGGFGANGVWNDVEIADSGEKMGELYSLLSDVNEFRNTRVAHVEVKLSDVNEAWENMGKWVKCLVKISGLQHRHWKQSYH